MTLYSLAAHAEDPDMPLSRDETVQIVVDAAQASDDAIDQLMAPVYADLRALAAAYMRGDASNTLQPTALVNEVYLKLAGDRDWESPAHFMAVAAKAMRQILIDHARAKNALKRGGDRAKLELADEPADARTDETHFERLDGALRRLGEFDERAARVVELKFFGGLTNEEVATVLDIGRTTVAADWKHARAWLRHTLAQTD